MIAAIFAAVLITQTYDGKFTITEAPSMHACEEAKCVALEGVPCAGVAKAKAEREATARQEEAYYHGKEVKHDAGYLAAHPERVKQCKLKKTTFTCDTKFDVDMAVVGYSTGLDNEGTRLATVMSPDAVSQAWCAQ